MLFKQICRLIMLKLGQSSRVGSPEGSNLSPPGIPTLLRCDKCVKQTCLTLLQLDYGKSEHAFLLYSTAFLHHSPYSAQITLHVSRLSRRQEEEDDAAVTRHLAYESGEKPPQQKKKSGIVFQLCLMQQNLVTVIREEDDFRSCSWLQNQVF